MQQGRLLSILFTASLCILLLTGCNPKTSIILTDNESIANLNEQVKDKFVRLKTVNGTYEGENLVIRKDSSFIKNLPAILREIPNSSGNDSISTFDELLPAPFGFPTKDLTRIQIKSSNGQAMIGMGLGMASGVIIGATGGFTLSQSSSYSGSHEDSNMGPVLIIGGCFMGGGLGALFGYGAGAFFEKWEQIDVTVKFPKD